MVLNVRNLLIITTPGADEDYGCSGLDLLTSIIFTSCPKDNKSYTKWAVLALQSAKATTDCTTMHHFVFEYSHRLNDKLIQN